MRTKLASWLLIALATCAACWALVSPHLFPLHDYVHVARVAEMSRALSDGQFPVRWSSNFGYGYGMPLFEFYGPLPFYVGALLSSLGLPSGMVLRALFVLVSALSAVGAFKLGKALFGTSGGVLVATAYTLAPYRAVNLYIRGALAETGGMMALPWIFYATILMWQKKPYAWLILTGSLLTLFLSHNLVTLIALPFIALWMVTSGLFITQLTPRSYFQTVTRLAGVGLLAVALAGFYLFPAFLEKNATQVATLITGGYFDYHLHFLYIRQFFTPGWGYGGSGWGVQDGFSFFLGWGQLVGMALTMFVLGREVLKRRAVEWRLAVLILSITIPLVIALLFTTFKTQPIWEAVPLFSYIQFPWRFLSIASLYVALLGGFFVTQLKPLARSIFTVVLLCLLLGNAAYFRPERYLDDDTGLYYTDAQRIRTEMSGILPDFIPATATEFIKDVPNDGSALLCQRLESCGFEPIVLVQRSHQSLVSMQLTEEQNIIFAISDFPGWQAEIDGKKVEHSLSPEGLIQVSVPAGTHQVGVQFGSTPVRRWSDVVSLSAVFIAMIGVWRESQPLSVAPAVNKRKHVQRAGRH